jgi:hypothetical protein
MIADFETPVYTRSSTSSSDNIREELFDKYARHDEDLESFCDRMADRYGVNWTSVLKP